MYDERQDAVWNEHLDVYYDYLCALRATLFPLGFHRTCNKLCILRCVRHARNGTPYVKRAGWGDICPDEVELRASNRLVCTTARKRSDHAWKQKESVVPRRPRFLRDHRGIEQDHVEARNASLDFVRKVAPTVLTWKTTRFMLDFIRVAISLSGDLYINYA